MASWFPHCRAGDSLLEESRTGFDNMIPVLRRDLAAKGKGKGKGVPLVSTESKQTTITAGADSAGRNGGGTTAPTVTGGATTG